VRLSAGIIVNGTGSLGPESKHVKERAPPLLLGTSSILVIRLASTTSGRHLLDTATKIIHNGAASLLERLGRLANHDLELKVLNVVVGLDLLAAAVGEGGARVEDVAAEGAGQGNDYSALLAGDLQGLLGERLGETLADPVWVRDDGMEEDDLLVASKIRLLSFRDA
jgi:hypothetical protein